METRFIVQFADKTAKRISEKEAKALMKAKQDGKGCILRGAFFDSNFIKAIKPITKEWFSGEFVRQQSGISDRKGTLMLSEGFDRDSSEL